MRRTARVVATLGLTTALVACADAPQEAPPAPGAQPGGGGVTGGKADTAFTDGPLYLTGAFDGSKSFNMWAATLEFAREVKRDHGKRVGFTYFINTCYYDTEVTGSDIGRALSRDETIARWAITQQAINEGHEIANHSVRHKDGGAWSKQRWETEVQEFHHLLERNLFQPIRDAEGRPVFPDYQPRSDVAGAQGAACAADSECDSGLCLPVTDALSLCSARCNKHNPCADGMACGAPDWNSSRDVCLPLPRFPVEHEGEVLFDAEGNPNLDHPALEPYRVVGFRAPLLAHNSALFEVLTAFDYRYDTSKILQPGPPQKTLHQGTIYETLYQFALMKNPGSRTIPMDYNYYVNDTSGDRMQSDYRASILDAYNARERQPWNIGHHFSLWKNGAYWGAMKDAFVFAAKGCPDEAGQQRCADVLFPTFIELADVLDGKIDAERVALGPKADGLAEDIFRSEVSREQENDSPAFCVCGDEEHH